MIRKVKDFDSDLIKIFPILKEDTLYVRKTIGGVATKDESTKTEKGEFTSTGYITTLDIDRDRDVIMPNGIDWTEYDKNNVVLNMHNYRDIPVGKCTKRTQTSLGWLGTTKYFVNAARDSQGFKNWEYREAGFPLGRSIGFAPTEYAINSKYGEEFEKGWKDAMKQWEKEYKSAYGKNPEGTPDIIYTKSIAFEYSDVTVPANPSCVGEEETKGINLIEISKGLNTDGRISIDKLMEMKSKFLEYESIRSNTISEEEMGIKEILEAQKIELEGLKTQIKEMQTDKENKEKEAELKAEKAEAKRLADEETAKIAKEKEELENDKDTITLEDFEKEIKEATEGLINDAIEKLNETLAKFQDNMDRLTGTI